MSNPYPQDVSGMWTNGPTPQDDAMKTMDPVEFATLVVLARMPESMWTEQARPIMAGLSAHARELAKALRKLQGRQKKGGKARSQVARDLRFIRQFAGEIAWPT